MASIRDYDGPIYLCTACGQPCHEEDNGEYGMIPMHFDEQWDGIYCHMHPLAAGLITVNWNRESLQELKEKYPDTYPHYSAKPSAAPQG